jgi:hypothetical protein
LDEEVAVQKVWSTEDAASTRQHAAALEQANDWGISAPWNISALSVRACIG